MPPKAGLQLVRRIRPRMRHLPKKRHPSCSLSSVLHRSKRADSSGWLLLTTIPKTLVDHCRVRSESFEMKHADSLQHVHCLFPIVRNTDHTPSNCHSLLCCYPRSHARAHELRDTPQIWTVLEHRRECHPHAATGRPRTSTVRRRKRPLEFKHTIRR